ncbi:MAG: hypothetical protein UX38_C0005G0036 [Microgenomates group bacterium GW2011_GWC1_46_16]|uniref:Uncharacterized protein n=2 Tax=Candidatus Collieribacteriota TaxID=1752725 RepID=A0A1F5FYW8_9BACT|nr:MAG: hypothetical protein UX32_C0007G0017 [Microgenomates group bacterium GW2011_GWF1_46_12]KKU26533.1 MAG: hypothetical protein UX38_C0005G0036 [Microgenomates group bacterium GW2011_GWC1_46_16]KKU28204.1 MAG: hypothetical protein UX40_C0002G0044 [Microgenomates group bacterium GW2011_GWF2_46_18]KKU43898.1 MAG: hypothetical protein UX59_C0007G0025 [Microgenomates group bacterium GW2011_GWA1_46_7]KKU45579.1 MAG: hypothetical protein UX63_C0003G0005 [Microgenomates group bacterium GW2011_GWB1
MSLKGERGEIKTDMFAAWQSAKSIQIEENIKNGDVVVIEGDPYTFWFNGIDPTTGLAHLFRQGHPEDGEPAWVSRMISVANVVTLENMTRAMALHTNVDLHSVNGAEEIINLVTKR